MDHPPKIVFMGTPHFAVPALLELHESRHTVSLVVTQPDRPKGRGRKIHPPPVKQAAMDLGYSVVQPLSIRDPEFFGRLEALQPDLFVVIAYGRILSPSLLNMPKLGAVNIHASLLPKYRGPAPIQWAVINGEKETGVTAMRMNAGLDTGDILLAEKSPVHSDDTSKTLHDRLARMGAVLLLKTLDRFDFLWRNAAPQDPALATYAPLLRKKDGHINWNMDAAAIECMIRGMDPWPGAFSFLGDRRLRIYRAQTLPENRSGPPGTVIESFPDELRVAAGTGALSIMEIQGSSGRRLDIQDFLRGCPVPPGTVLT